MKTKLSDIKQFLLESNAIEDVWDNQSYLDAKKAWDFLVKHNKLTLDIILKTHKILMANQAISKDEKGQLRKVAVYIGNREGKPWYVLPELMAQWVKRANDSVQIGLIYGEEDLQRDHVEFETIHPFVDGNGRMGRLLMNWQRVKIGKDILIIRNDKKYEYYSWFQ